MRPQAARARREGSRSPTHGIFGQFRLCFKPGSLLQDSLPPDWAKCFFYAAERHSSGHLAPFAAVAARCALAALEQLAKIPEAHRGLGYPTEPAPGTSVPFAVWLCLYLLCGQWVTANQLVDWVINYHSYTPRLGQKARLQKRHRGDRLSGHMSPNVGCKTVLDVFLAQRKAQFAIKPRWCSRAKTPDSFYTTQNPSLKGPACA